MKKHKGFADRKAVIPRRVTFVLLIVFLCVSCGFAMYNAVEALGWATMASDFKLGIKISESNYSETVELYEEEIAKLEALLVELRMKKR